ncbi:hypothetical protein RM844_01145 [Streptomyces sp. DSM 44915]|uniref:Uncharacterized protein n=1 Tax=Streptomyces chisholmiae TaxID=3075540 RepID=A0ABU2JK57_9ACTN|nr:hypothetical protein [Streptomyces sp. DSM 44915]MDT0264889.1 hypothetical protein [Streptomyces sp. DSM 44915]
MAAPETRPPRDLAELTAVLTTGFDLIRPVAPELPHRLVGTAAARLQGVDLPVGDIDLLLAGRGDVHAVATALAGHPCVTPPVWLAAAAQYYACYRVGGVGFSVSTVERPGADAAWRHHVPVTVGAHRVHCVRLELHLPTEFLRDRPDRYRPLLAHLATHGVDHALLRLAMAAHAVPARFAALISDLPAR